MGTASTALRLCRRAVGHWRTIILLLILALAGLLIIQGEFFELLGIALILIFIASQLFRISRILDLSERLIPAKPSRSFLAIIAGLLYLFVLIYSYNEWAFGHTIRASDYRLQSIVIHAVFWWWFVGSMLSFVLIIAFGVLDRIIRAALWIYGKARQAFRPESDAANGDFLSSSSRRRFLERTVVLVSATPFAAAAYGLLYERLDVEVVRERARLARLPKAFEGFRIALLSDIHISPFANADYIRRCVSITNSLKPDLIALTGTTSLGTPRIKLRWFVCWLGSERLTAYSDAWGITRPTRRSKTPSPNCLLATVFTCSASSAHQSPWAMKSST